MQITEAGRQAVAAEKETENTPAAAGSELLAAPVASGVVESSPAAEAARGAPAGQYEAPGRPRLRDAVCALLSSWDANDGTALAPAVETLRAALQRHGVARIAGTLRQPRKGTKQQEVLALLRRPEGATMAQVAEAG